MLFPIFIKNTLPQATRLLSLIPWCSATMEFVLTSHEHETTVWNDVPREIDENDVKTTLLYAPCDYVKVLGEIAMFCDIDDIGNTSIKDDERTKKHKAGIGSIKMSCDNEADIDKNNNKYDEHPVKEHKDVPTHVKLELRHDLADWQKTDRVIKIVNDTKLHPTGIVLNTRGLIGERIHAQFVMCIGDCEHIVPNILIYRNDNRKVEFKCSTNTSIIKLK